MVSGMRIRPMTSADLPFAAECTRREGWVSEGRDLFEGFLANDPEGCVIAEAAGAAIGMCVATSYGPWGFVGELIVLPEHRGRGLGRHLLDHAVTGLRARGARCVLLDGVPQAVSLYERAGFRRICRSLRFVGRPAARTKPEPRPDRRRPVRAEPGPRRAARWRPMRAEDLDEVAALDRTVFGGDRRFFLERRFHAAPHLCRVLQADNRLGGYAVTRTYEGGMMVGPWVQDRRLEAGANVVVELARVVGATDRGARDESARVAGATDHGAATDRGAASEPQDRGVVVGVLDSNACAVEAVAAAGLVERPNPPWRMALGEWDRQADHPWQFGIGSPAKG